MGNVARHYMSLDLLPDAVQKVRTMTHEDSKPRVRFLVVDRSSGGMRGSLPVPGWRRVGVAAAISVTIALAGCATMQQHLGGWFGGATPTPTPAPVPRGKPAAQGPRVYFAGAEGLKLYSEPSASAKVVGTLSLHEKVTRSKLERGFAYVESAKSGLKGWVINAQLIWRVPGVAPNAPPAAEEPETEAPEAPAAEEPQAPEAPEAAAPAAEQPPTPTPAPPAPAAPAHPPPTPAGVAPSIFNPY